MSQVAEQMESLETYCEWASQNLENLDFDQKRLALEALDVQVSVDGKKVMIRGFLPVGSPSFFPASSTPGGLSKDPDHRSGSFTLWLNWLTMPSPSDLSNGAIGGPAIIAVRGNNHSQYELFSAGSEIATYQADAVIGQDRDLI